MDERVEPRISVNKLGEYMTCRPARRKRIIYDQRHPSEFIIARYVKAVNTIREYFSNPSFDEDSMAKEIDDLVTNSSGTDWEIQNNQLCAEALEAFMDLMGEIDIDGWGVILPELSETAAISINAMDVSVRPEILLKKQDGQGQDVFGAIKLYFSKTYELDKHAGEYITTIIRTYLSELYSSAGGIDLENCILIDIPHGHIYSAPRAYKRRLNDVKAAIDEIKTMWPTV